MNSAQEDNCRTDYRVEALVCALRTCASVTSDLLAAARTIVALELSQGAREQRL